MGCIWGEYGIYLGGICVFQALDQCPSTSDEEEALAEGVGEGYSLPELPAPISRVPSMG